MCILHLRLASSPWTGTICHFSKWTELVSTDAAMDNQSWHKQTGKSWVDPTCVFAATYWSRGHAMKTFSLLWQRQILEIMQHRFTPFCVYLLYLYREIILSLIGVIRCGFPQTTPVIHYGSENVSKMSIRNSNSSFLKWKLRKVMEFNRKKKKTQNKEDVRAVGM